MALAYHRGRRRLTESGRSVGTIEIRRAQGIIAVSLQIATGEITGSSAYPIACYEIVLDDDVVFIFTNIHLVVFMPVSHMGCLRQNLTTVFPSY